MERSLLRTDEELSAMYQRHVDTVYRVCFVYMKNSHDTEDMVQNTFIRLIRDKTVFKSTEHEKAWLIRTASNLCKDHFKSWWQRTVKLKNEVFDVKVEKFEVDETLLKILSLPTKYKIVVYMYYYEGYSTVEIAGIFGKSESTIRSQLHTAQKRLKIMIEEEKDE